MSPLAFLIGPFLVLTGDQLSALSTKVTQLHVHQVLPFSFTVWHQLGVMGEGNMCELFTWWCRVLV